MGSYTPNLGLYKPGIGETDWGDKVNANFDTLDEEVSQNSLDIADILNNKLPPLQTDVAYNKTQISKIKKEILTIALNVMMHKALLNAETKDFYSIIADVTTPEQQYGFKNTLESLPAGVMFDNNGGGQWTEAIKITLTTTPTQYAVYKIVIQSNTMQIYSADGTLKADYGAQTGIASAFWSNVKSDGSDIRVADQNYQQLYFYVEEFDYANSYAVIWVRIPEGTSELYIAYGNSQATKSSYEDPEQVFEFYDGFEDADISDWTIYSGNWQITTDAYKGSYALKRQNIGTPTDSAGKTLVYDRTYTLKIELAVKLTENAGTTPVGLLIREKSSDNGYLFAWGRAGTASSVKLWTAGAAGDTLASGGSGISANQWYAAEVIIKPDGTIIFRDGTGAEITVVDSTYSNFDEFVIRPARQSVWDEIIAYKLADPAEFGEAETITLTTTGDFYTVTFDFPDGVDKLLITVDTDATAIYYSTDDGATWNAIAPDEETLLPETAYSIKWKFEFASYVRGYAFITW